MPNAIFDKDETIIGSVLRPKDAATLILTRRDGDAARILLGQRHSSMAFMAGKFVFPGGRVDLCDRRLAAGGPLNPQDAARLGDGGRALALAAIRETFEETGLLIGRRDQAPPFTRAVGWRRFFAHGVVPELACLRLIGRAITPPKRPRRFDARFFMADASAIAAEVGADSEELLKLCWVTLKQARALDLPAITRRMIDEVEARLSGDSQRPVPFFRFQRGLSLVDYL